MERLVGRELIDNLEDLRSELENLISINNDMRVERQSKNKNSGNTTNADSKSNVTSSKGDLAVNKKAPPLSIFSETKNASFLNQELMFFIDNLQAKARQSGLKEDALIPRYSDKDRKIYTLISKQNDESGRPQSAFTSQMTGVNTESN